MRNAREVSARFQAAEFAVAGIATQSLYLTSCKASSPLNYTGTTWRFHVVPVLNIEGRELIADVAMGRKLPTKEAWLAQLGTSDFNAHYASSARYHHGTNALPLQTYDNDGDVADCRRSSQFDPAPAMVSEMPRFHLAHLLTACSQMKYFANREHGAIKAADVAQGVKTLIGKLKATGLLVETGDEFNDCWE